MERNRYLMCLLLVKCIMNSIISFIIFQAVKYNLLKLILKNYFCNRNNTWKVILSFLFWHWQFGHYNHVHCLFSYYLIVKLLYVMLYNKVICQETSWKIWPLKNNEQIWKLCRVIGLHSVWNHPANLTVTGQNLENFW